jgi:NADH-quinone oxidoreductase subunit J
MHASLYQVIFYIFAGLTVLSAILVITQNNPVRCVLFLVLAFFCSAVLWLMVNAEFLSLILVLVYVGAVMTLFLFVIMMLNIDVESMKTNLLRYLPFGLVLVALLVSLLVIVIPANQFKDAIERSEQVVQVNDRVLSGSSGVATSQSISNTEALGGVLYTDYLFAFELAAVILLVAIVAAITLVHRGPIRSKRQDIVTQMMVRRRDRVKLIKMNSEKP